MWSVQPQPLVNASSVRSEHMNSSFGYLSLSLNASNELELSAGVEGDILRINPNLVVEAGRGPLENR